MPIAFESKLQRSPSVDRLAFADLLRGLAALIVVIGHYTIVYLTSPDVVAGLTNAEPIERVVLPTLLNLNHYFNAAAVGVAVFFLISGFVIPLSIETSPIRGYFLKRVLRIYPTFWCALALNVVALAASSAYWGKVIPLTWRDYLFNIVLITEWSGRFDILSVAWTLLIELKFYLLAPLVFWLVSRRATAALLVWAFGIVAAYWLATAGCSDDLITCWGRRAPWVYVAWEGMYITFMLIGSVFYAHFRKRIGTLTAAVLIGTLFGCFAVSFNLSHLAVSSPWLETVGAYAEGLAIFGGLFAMRNHVKLLPLFRYLADISYPLYVVHPLVGYVSMRLLMAQDLPYLAALPIALLLSFTLATLIHRFVEKPSLALGKRLSRGIARQSVSNATVPAE